MNRSRSSLFFVWVVVWSACLVSLTAAYEVKYLQLYQQLTDVSSAVLAWRQAPEGNAKPVAELRAVVEVIEADFGYFRYGERYMRKKGVADTLSAKLVELESAASPEELSADFDETVLAQCMELELLSWRSSFGHMFRLVIGS